MKTKLKLNRIKTLIITGKSWFDRVNGNSYCSARCTINFGLKSEMSFAVPFQYGYGNFYKQAALEKLAEMTGESSNEISARCFYGGTIHTHATKQENCLKRDVVAWGA